jgi:hypothetical protein
LNGVSQSFADGIRLKWIPEINKIKKPTYSSVTEWLEIGSYRWMPSTNSQQAFIDIRGAENSFAQALASEASRFSCAAYESRLDIEPSKGSSKSLGWAIVRFYYSAFYCSHALLRIMGESLTYLSGETAIKLNKVGGQYLGYSPSIASGLHYIKRTTSDPNIISIEKISSGGGSHEDMWKILLTLLVDIENKITLSQGSLPFAISAVEKSKKLRAQLCYKGKNNGGWLSSVRNAVNYRHEHGIWFPYQITERKSVELRARMENWKSNSSNDLSIENTKDELGLLIDSSNFLAKILLIALLDISKRTPSTGKSFVDLYPLKYLRDKKISH